MNRRHLLPIGSALVAAGMIVTACSSSAASPTPSPAAPSLAAPTFAIPSAPPSFAIPSIAGPGGSFAIPSFGIPSFSFPSEDKDLEARLPNQLNGVTLTKFSFKGSTFLQSGGDTQKDMAEFLSSIGKSPDDLSVALASDPSDQLDVQLGAFRVAGADSGVLLQAFVTATKKENPQDTVTQGNVGGKNVTQIVDPTDSDGQSDYVYANGDTLFFVSSPDATLAAAALQAMP